MNKLYFCVLLLLMACASRNDYDYSSKIYQQQTDTLIATIIENNFIVNPDSIRKYYPNVSFKLSPEITHKQFYWVLADSRDSILTKGAIKLPLNSKMFFEAANRDTSNWIINEDSLGIYKVTDGCKRSLDNFCVHFEKPVFSPDYKRAYIKIDLLGEGKAMWLEKENNKWVLNEQKTTWVE